MASALFFPDQGSVRDEVLVIIQASFVEAALDDVPPEGQEILYLKLLELLAEEVVENPGSGIVGLRTHFRLFFDIEKP